jgi:hypothetical protein
VQLVEVARRSLAGNAGDGTRWIRGVGNHIVMGTEVALLLPEAVVCLHLNRRGPLDELVVGRSTFHCP